MELSRRKLLHSAAGAATLSGMSRIASAQGTPRIEQFAPELDQIISTGEPIREIADGFDAAAVGLGGRDGLIAVNSGHQNSFRSLAMSTGPEKCFFTSSTQLE
jgi:hypothetical protein